MEKRRGFFLLLLLCRNRFLLQHSSSQLVRRLFLPFLLRLWQAPGTGLHGNGDAHTAASDGHVGDAQPFVPVRAVTLNAGQEALLVETSCKHADEWN